MVCHFQVKFWGKDSHEEDNDVLRAPLGTFYASASTSSTRKKRRMSRSRRVRFTPITLPKSPEVRAMLRAFDVARKRGMRNKNRVIEPVLHLTASDALRQRKSRTSRTIGKRILARSINTQQRRSLRGRLSQLSRRPTPNLSAQHFRKAINELKWGWCLECNTKFPNMSARGLCNFCKKDKDKHSEYSLFSARNLMNPGRVPIELSRLTNLESLLIAPVHPVMSVYRVKAQHYKYGRNVINFVQDVNVIASVLPHKTKDLSAVLVIKRTGMNSTKEFVVRREYVRKTLLWMENKHAYYHGISISDGNINEIPENDIPDDLLGMGVNEDQQRNDSLFGEQSNEDGYDGPLELQDQSFHINEFETVGTIGTIVQPDQQSCTIRALESVEADQTIVDMPFAGELNISLCLVINKLTMLT